MAGWLRGLCSLLSASLCKRRMNCLSTLSASATTFKCMRVPSVAYKGTSIGLTWLVMYAQGRACTQNAPAGSEELRQLASLWQVQINVVHMGHMLTTCGLC